MPRRKDELSFGKRWAGPIFFAVGIALLLLFVYAPGQGDRGEVLKIIGAGLVSVGVVVWAGVNLPQFDWSGILIRILTALLKEQKGGDGA